MTALSTERLTTGAKLSRGTYPVAANTRIFKGALVVLNSSGQAIPGTVIASGAAVAVGKASHTVDNRTGSALGGAAGAADVEVEFGVFGWESATSADLIEADDIGKIAYVLDDQTVALTPDTDARIAAGVIVEVREGKVFVDMSPTIFRSIS